jgi:DNA-binding beta-propeller fold protein YncE
MSRQIISRAALVALSALFTAPAQCEILAMLNYESKPTEQVRKEGIAVIDIDPASPNFNKIMKDIPLPADMVAHHIFYNPEVTKAYVTSLGRSELRIFDLKTFPDTMAVVDVPDCKVGEDIVFSEDRKTWYLSCMGSSNVVVGDAQTDKVSGVIAAADGGGPFIKTPHGIALNDDLDRIMVTSTMRPDFTEPGETVTVIEASTRKVLSTHKVSNKPSPSGAAPVEIAFLPRAESQMAYITNFMDGTLWTATWWPQSKTFTFQEAYDFAAVKQGAPLEMVFNDAADRLYVTTAKPGHLDIFDISGDRFHPKLIKSIPAAAGAHHIVFSPDRRYAFVQNSLLNLPDMSDGSVTVIDLEKNEAVAQIDVLKKAGYNPNCIIMLPKWYSEES